MSYVVDQETGDIVISGFEQGIGDSPYSGLTDMKSVNPITTPGEASVAFSTNTVTGAPQFSSQSGTLTSGATLGILTIADTLGLATGQWVSFDSISNGSTGLLTNTPYYAKFIHQNAPNAGYDLYTNIPSPTGVGTVLTTSTNATVTVSTVNPANINFFQKSKSNNFALDANGRVWSDFAPTGSAPNGITISQWTYLGNTTDATSNGNGMLVYTTVSNSTGGTGTAATPATFDEWLFVWRNSQIDYTQLSKGSGGTVINWVNGWNYKVTTGTSTGATLYLRTAGTVNNPHHAIVTPDARVNFVDGSYLGNFYQNIPALGSSYVGFDPAVSGTWTPQTFTALMPATEVGQCLAFVNQYLLIGGKGNIIYPWDLNPAHNTYSTPLIQLPETNISALVTVGNNAYIFAGNRGNVYITNGAQASFFKKVPDHLSPYTEPFISWGNGTTTAGCATFNKNRLYFGVNVTARIATPSYGGLWCIDLQKNTIFNAQQMQYGTYNGSVLVPANTYQGYVSAVGISVGNNVVGTNVYGPNTGYGLLAGWSSGINSLFGVDANIGTPYTGTQATVVSDLIPIGTLLDKKTPTQLEFKLSEPLISGESVQLFVGSSLADYQNGTMTFVGSTSTPGALSGNFPNPLQGNQWILLQAELSSIASSNTNPSYVRLEQMRIIK